MNKLKYAITCHTRLVMALIFIIGIQTNAREWQPDRFLAGFEETTINQPADYEGDVTCTIIRKLPEHHTSTGILYVHGFNDYFFQAEMGDRFVDSCYMFYAVDLRKYGRSLSEAQKPCNVRNIDEYYADLDSALCVMKADGVSDIVLMGHSTGGLVVASYMNHRDSTSVDAVILNSPFLDWNMSGVLRSVGIPMVSCLGAHFPNMKIPQGGGAYGESIYAGAHGEWNFDTRLKTLGSRDVTAGWVRAINNAQKALRNNPLIACPILLMHSARSINANKWSEACQEADAVLNVEDISRIGRILGPTVTEATFEGGLHDLILSKEPVRNEVYQTIFAWLKSLGLTPINDTY